ncbi:MAG: hypothetical protein ACK4TK_04545 [Thiobacillaceae bacterium]
MQTRMKALASALSLCAGLLWSQGSTAQTAAPAAAMPQTHEEWVQYLSNFTQNADMLVDPKKFVAALNAVTEPRFVIAALNAMMNPNLYMQSVATLMDPRAYSNYARTMDPKVVADWTQALMDPQFFAAVSSVFADPNKLARWVMAPLDPAVMSVVLNLLNPNVYLRWGTVGLDPRLWTMLSNTMNPNWYGAWMGGMPTPPGYGPGFGSWIQPPYGTPLPYALPGAPFPGLMPSPQP